MTEYERDKAKEKDHLFKSLAEHIKTKNLFDVYLFLLERSKRTKNKNQYQTTLRLTGCAILSSLDTTIDLKGVFDNLIEQGAWAKYTGNRFPAIPTSVSEVEFFLKQFIWKSQEDISSCWDAIKQFAGERVEASKDKTIAVAIYPYKTDNPDLVAWLSAQAFEGMSDGLICFRNPRNMSFIDMDPGFENSLKTSQKFAWKLAKENGCPPADVRWEIEDLNSTDPIKLVKDQSIGAAFALVLAKALHTYANVQSNVVE